ncbi:MAG: hypothetical protein IJJ66_10795, partial [Treponema sp.]|nr:hypothetical protein [Treponema sp.]
MIVIPNKKAPFPEPVEGILIAKNLHPQRAVPGKHLHSSNFKGRTTIHSLFTDGQKSAKKSLPQTACHAELDSASLYNIVIVI